MKQRKTNLDEQQERRLLELESRGFWLAFWGLVVAFLVQMLVFDDIRAFGGEIVLLLIVALYFGISCVRAGIWDRRMDMSRKTCLLGALIAALVIVVFWALYAYTHSRRPVAALCVSLIGGLITFAITYFGLSMMARATKKRQDELNAEPEEEETE